VSADVTKESPSWTPSYSATSQGSSPHFESQAILENDPEPTPAVAEDSPAVTQEEDPEPVVADPVVKELTSQVVASTKVCDEVDVLRCLSS
jgi:hypothetical protein